MEIQEASLESKEKSTSRDSTSQLTTYQGIFTPTWMKSIQTNPRVFSLKVQLVAAGVDVHLNLEANQTKLNLKWHKSECWVCYSVNINEVQPSRTGPSKYQNKRHLGWWGRTRRTWRKQTHHVSLAHLLQHRWACSKIFYWRVMPNQYQPSHRMPIDARIHTWAVIDPRIQNAAPLCQWSLLTWCKKLKKSSDFFELCHFPICLHVMWHHAQNKIFYGTSCNLVAWIHQVYRLF